MQFVIVPGDLVTSIITVMINLRPLTEFPLVPLIFHLYQSSNYAQCKLFQQNFFTLRVNRFHLYCQCYSSKLQKIQYYVSTHNCHAFAYVVFFSDFTFNFFQLISKELEENDPTKKNYNPERNIWRKIDKSSKTRQDKKSLISFLRVFFYCFYESLISGRETGHQAISPPKFQIFLLFHYFLKSQVLSRSATRGAARLPSLLY